MEWPDMKNQGSAKQNDLDDYITDNVQDMDVRHADQHPTLESVATVAIERTTDQWDENRWVDELQQVDKVVCMKRQQIEKQGAGNLLNAVVDPILIFLLGLGIGVGFLVGRTIAVLITMTISTSKAAREGPVPMASHQICLQVWLVISLLNDALALTGQALLASEYTKKNYKQARIIVYRGLQVCQNNVTGIALSVLLFFGFESFSTLFTTDFAVLQIASSGVLFVSISQPINAIAFVIDGVYSRRHLRLFVCCIFNGLISSTLTIQQHYFFTSSLP
ncbi:hypothetical protein ZIOFF_035848 [Zingiber officinale]|uniref:Uncharacterized protein n=1 Tax=Zingiber officinale TaxID=94328 RepID=A0A8J5GL61_ZINOF|nr:hypothetical protein ZIOFF_035848 [Zingiber officinale]